MKFWLVVNVRICERLHCNHWKYILKDTYERISALLHGGFNFRENRKWGCLRARRWVNSRHNHGGQYRGNCHPGVRLVEVLSTAKPLSTRVYPFPLTNALKRRTCWLYKPFRVALVSNTWSFNGSCMCVSGFLYASPSSQLCETLHWWKCEIWEGTKVIKDQVHFQSPVPDISTLTGPHLPSRILTVCLASQSIMMTQSSRALSHRWL